MAEGVITPWNKNNQFYKDLILEYPNIVQLILEQMEGENTKIKKSNNVW